MIIHYLINSEITKLVPKEDAIYDITDLISLSKKRKKKIGVYHVSDKNWSDLGTTSAFQKN